MIIEDTYRLDTLNPGDTNKLQCSVTLTLGVRSASKSALWPESRRQPHGHCRASSSIYVGVCASPRVGTTAVAAQVQLTL
jgi:hypothetical protein